MELLVIIKLSLLLVGFVFLSANFVKVIYKNNIPSSNILLMSIGIIGFIVLQFELYK